MAKTIQIVITVKDSSNKRLTVSKQPGYTYGQLGSILLLVPEERTGAMKSKNRFLILKYLNFSIRIYDLI